MKSKDQILLEDAYQKVLKEVVNTSEELPDWDMKMSSGNLDKLDKSNLYTQEDDRDEENDSNPSVMSEYQNFLTEEGDNLDVLVFKFLRDFVDMALKNSAVLKHFSEKYSLSSENLDEKYMLIQHLLVDFVKQSTLINMSTSMQDQIAQKFAK